MSEGTRKLAAIMFTDIVGYTALTQRDEKLALKLLDLHRGLVRPIFARHSGREVKTVGDAFLTEFDSALDATECAVDMQKALHEHNERGAERVLIRVGIHLGDVIHRDGDVYGDDVNIASRIAPLAQPGGICITDQVYAQIRNKMEYPIISVGSIGLKNVDLPIEIYVVSLPWASYLSPDSQAPAEAPVKASDPIISSIKNYLARVNSSQTESLPKLINKLAIKNEIVDVEMLNDPGIPPALGKFSTEVDYGRAETFRVVTGVETVKVIIDSNNLNKLLALIPKKNVKRVIGNLAEIVVSQPTWMLDTPGVVAIMTNALFESGVNLREFLTCAPATIIVVEEKDAWKAYEALRRFQ